MIHSEVAAKHVFVVENDKNMSHALRYNLEANGYRVTTQADGLEAAEQMRAGDVDLVAFDLDSPLMPGIMLVDALRIHHSDVPVLLLSSRSLGEQQNRGYEIGTEDFVSKPFELDELLAHVSALVPASEHDHVV